MTWGGIILALIASLPGVYGIWSGRRKMSVEAGETASQTTREEFKTLYTEMRMQLEDARRGWSACRSECTSLRISLDLEEQKTDALERSDHEKRIKISALEHKVDVLEEDLSKERSEREALQRIVDRRTRGSRDA
jgi:flagellar biosynthesis chaperone FliJ